MILLDYNQIAISNIMMNQNMVLTKEFEDDGLHIIRHMILNSIHSYLMKFGNKFGKLVICCDGRHYWRKKIFSYYKQNRKKNRDDSPINWTLLFENLNTIREELKEYFPYRVICLDEIEADDIIAVSVKYFYTKEPVLIISSDKDFCQLQRYDNVYQFSPVQKKYIVESNPVKFLREHIIRGDSGDGIPNILSPDDCFVSSKRQTRLTTMRVDSWVNSDIELEELFKDNLTALSNVNRNKLLIDFEMIPAEIQNKILNVYSEPFAEDRSKLFNYFINNRLKELHKCITEF